MSTPSIEPTRPETLERQAFMALVQAAIKKTAARQPLSDRERRAWTKWEAEEDERRGRRFVSRVPKKTYLLWSGRQTKILHDQADLYGLPLRAATIDVPEVIAWLHDFLAQWKHHLAPLVKGGAIEGQPLGLKEQLLSEQVAIYRMRVKLLEDNLQERHKHLIPRGEVHTLLAQLATVLRAAGDRLQKQFGPDAASILDVALDDYEAALVQLDAKNGEELPPSEHAAAADDRRNPLVDQVGEVAADPPTSPVVRRGARNSRRRT